MQVVMSDEKRIKKMARKRVAKQNGSKTGKMKKKHLHRAKTETA